MTRRFPFDIALFMRKAGIVILAVCFLAGLASGAAAYLFYGRFSFSLMGGTVSVSIVGQWVAVLFPFLISALAVFISKPWLLFPVAFCKGFSFLYVSLGLMAWFDVSGGFFRLLLMFSDIVCLPQLYLYWHRHVCGVSSGSFAAVFAQVSLVFLIGSVDLSVVLPLITDVFIF